MLYYVHPRIEVRGGIYPPFLLKRRNMAQMIRSGFLALLEQVAKERKIQVDDVVESIEIAIEAALRKDRPDLFSEEEDEDGPQVNFFVELDRTEGSAKIYRTVDGGEREDVTPAGFGRIAAQTAKNVIFQKVREAERNAMLDAYRGQIGELVAATVIRYDGRRAVVEMGRGQAYMPPEEQMRGEFYRPNLRIQVLIKGIVESVKGEDVIVSRSDENLIIKLFEREVPEMASKSVEVKSIAREAGVRTKMAVASDQSGVDPVGACVGQRGVRVQEVIREVNNEKIDIIQYSEDPQTYLAAALSPAESLVIKVDSKKKEAIVIAPEDQIRLVVGRGGQNVRLAAKLTGYAISVQSADGVEEARVTGQEQYEIDQYELTEELRDLLIAERATTIEDLARKWETLQTKEEMTGPQVESLQAAIAKWEKEQAEIEKKHQEMIASNPLLQDQRKQKTE